jgi:hypothetical protein
MAPLSCGQQESQNDKNRPTYESCLAEEKLFIAGTCFDGAGLKGADLRTLLFSEAPLLEALDQDLLEICILADSKVKAALPQLEQETRSSLQAWLAALQSLDQGTADTYFLGLYASDPSTVTESYGADKALNTFTVEDVRQEPKDRKALTLQLEIHEAQLHIQFNNVNQVWKESFSSCYIDPRLLDYYRTRGLLVPDALVRQSLYLLLRNQTFRLDSEGAINPKDGLRVFIDQPLPANTEILIFSRDSHDFITRVTFDSVTKDVTLLERGRRYIVDVEALQLPPGAYEAFVAADGTQFNNTLFILP